MNLSFTRGDDPECVKENFRRIGEAMGIPCEKMVYSRQTHTTNVRMVTEADAGYGVTRERPYTDVDGLVTNVPGICLVTSYADCVPLYFLDPKDVYKRQDVYRPAAIKQLQVNGEKQGVEVFSMGENHKPANIAKAALEHAAKNHNNVVILDTAGRLHVDEEMMAELQEIKDTVEVHQKMCIRDRTFSAPVRLFIRWS